ncbi:MAG TPA: DNA recombination protein RmuC [Rhizomicrobium sp.]|jgi:DNA recombination protein RmuC
MIESGILWAVLAMAAAGAAFFAGRFFRGAAGAATAETPVEFVRLQERERVLAEEVAKLETRLNTLALELEHQTAELNTARTKSATSEERIAGLERELARERELGGMTQKRLDGALTDAAREKDQLQAQASEETKRRAQAERSEAELRGQIERAGKHIADRDATIEGLRAQTDGVRQELASKQTELAAAAERESGLQRDVAERDDQLKNQQERLKTEFENVANRILAATANQLSAKSQESLAAILDPLKERITEFQNKVESTHADDTRERATIAEQIRQVASSGQALRDQAENLTKALKGDSQMRGRWGEVQLERILEQAGLERGREFVVQGGDFRLKSEDGGNLRPDVIVLLPEQRHLVIDSKLSLVPYLDYEAAADEDARAAALKKLIASVRAHAEDLSGKTYQTAAGLNAHDLVLMFVPIEGIAAAVLKNDDGLYAWCWERKVVMVSPSTLFMTMQTVASLWRYERQNDNAQEIARQAGQLFDKLSGVVEELNDVSDKIQKAANAHSEAMKKLATGQGNALGRAQKLKSLGVSSKKEMPFVILGGEKLRIEAGDDDVMLRRAAEPKLLEKPSDQPA